LIDDTTLSLHDALPICKLVVVWAAEADYDPESLQPGEFTATVGGKEVEFPEIDKVAWFDLETARMKLNPAYEPILDRLERTTVADRKSTRLNSSHVKIS